MKVSVYEPGHGDRAIYWTENGSGSFFDRSKIGVCIDALKAAIAFLERNQDDTAELRKLPAAVTPLREAVLGAPSEPTAQQCITRTVMEVAAAVRHLRQIGDIEDDDIHVNIQPIPSKSEPSADCWFSVKIPAKNPKPRDPEWTRVGSIMGAPLRRS